MGKCNACLWLVWAFLACWCLCAHAMGGCTSKDAVCSMTRRVRGTVTLAEKLGSGCFNNGNMQVIVDLAGFPATPQPNNNNNNKDNSKERVFSLRLKSYGEIIPACSGVGPDFGGLVGGDLGSYSADSRGLMFNESVYLPRTSALQGRDSVLGRSVVLYDGAYSLYGDNGIIDCCVLGMGVPVPGSTPDQGSQNLLSGDTFGGNYNAIGSNQFSGYNDIGANKFTLIPYGNNVGGLGPAGNRNNNYNNNNNSPNFAFQSSNPAFGGNRNPQTGGPLYGNGNSVFGSGNNGGPTNNGHYNNVYNTGSGTYSSNRNPIFGNSNYQGQGAAGGNNNNNYNNNNGAASGGSFNSRPLGYSKSQFPSVFNTIDSQNFFNLDASTGQGSNTLGNPNSGLERPTPLFETPVSPGPFSRLTFKAPGSEGATSFITGASTSSGAEKSTQQKTGNGAAPVPSMIQSTVSKNGNTFTAMGPDLIPTPMSGNSEGLSSPESAPFLSGTSFVNKNKPAITSDPRNAPNSESLGDIFFKNQAGNPAAALLPSGGFKKEFDASLLDGSSGSYANSIVGGTDFDNSYKSGSNQYDDSKYQSSGSSSDSNHNNAGSSSPKKYSDDYYYYDDYNGGDYYYDDQNAGRSNNGKQYDYDYGDGNRYKYTDYDRESNSGYALGKSNNDQYSTDTSDTSNRNKISTNNGEGYTPTGPKVSDIRESTSSSYAPYDTKAGSQNDGNYADSYYYDYGGDYGDGSDSYYYAPDDYSNKDRYANLASTGKDTFVTDARSGNTDRNYVTNNDRTYSNQDKAGGSAGNSYYNSRNDPTSTRQGYTDNSFQGDQYSNSAGDNGNDYYSARNDPSNDRQGYLANQYDSNSYSSSTGAGNNNNRQQGALNYDGNYDTGGRNSYDQLGNSNNRYDDGYYGNGGSETRGNAGNYATNNDNYRDRPEYYDNNKVVDSSKRGGNDNLGPTYNDRASPDGYIENYDYSGNNYNNDNYNDNNYYQQPPPKSSNTGLGSTAGSSHSSSPSSASAASSYGSEYDDSSNSYNSGQYPPYISGSGQNNRFGSNSGTSTADYPNPPNPSDTLDYLPSNGAGAGSASTGGFGSGPSSSSTSTSANLNPFIGPPVSSSSLTIVPDEGEIILLPTSNKKQSGFVSTGPQPYNPSK